MSPTGTAGGLFVGWNEHPLHHLTHRLGVVVGPADEPEHGGTVVQRHEHGAQLPHIDGVVVAALAFGNGFELGQKPFQPLGEGFCELWVPGCCGGELESGQPEPQVRPLLVGQVECPHAIAGDVWHGLKPPQGIPRAWLDRGQVFVQHREEQVGLAGEVRVDGPLGQPGLSGNLALLGSNGAGKTTVVKILSTLLKADAGTASVNGFDVSRQAAEVRGSISLTGQFAAVDEVLSGRENLVLVARLRHLENPGTIADDQLERFSLTEAAVRKVSTYSGGMRRRLDIAMSFVGNPQVIFFDEPTTGLDPQGRIEVWQAIKELAGHGTTVLLTTQYLEEAEQLADRIAILNDGRIIVNGSLGELRQLLPPAKIEYVEKQPTLDEVFLSIVGDDNKEGDAGDHRVDMNE